MTAPSLAPRDRGAVLVHVAILMLVLLAVSALTIDLGVMWLSRGQAQNAADAGAFAGAISLAFDGNDRSDTGPIKTKAVATANQNNVFGQSAGVIPADVTFPACPNPDSGIAVCDESPCTCVRVDVYRNVAHNNALPVFFARLFGITEQGVQAMAIAQAGYAGSANCMKPWAIPDRWEERPPYEAGEDPADYTTWSYEDGVDRYDGNEFLSDGLTLNPNYTGYKGPAWRNMPGGSDEGMLVTLKQGSPHETAVPGHFYPIDEPPPRPGGNVYRDDIANCNPTTYSPGDDLTVEPGDKVGPTRQGVNALVASDLGSVWNDLTKSVDCNPSLGPCTGLRIGAIAIYDPGIYQHSGRNEIQTKYLLGFYVVGMNGKDVMGRFVGRIGLNTGPGPKSSWLRIIQLIR